ncbi:NAD(P)H-dependent oxidoreductase subunit E [Paucibacter sp. PLA-PC-4]|uniref:(2Fe-2S) ferredoxin domain-containing protein n=1 Tax=Paucibacter sp. PLA-PC-4 TaxID=2993655 RepID=UPI0022498700|nr:NAD(P)H-dependent oxidoreductase subunit E [Paucibacter sp. PLA-PC-4]MCX2863161.1 NAD(P)H-dependent oxidoreductase subunit E [Paucibacter sp. PLA-PC-4]
MSEDHSNTIIKPSILPYRRHLLVCTGARCTQDGEAQAIFDSLGEKFKAAGIHEGELRVKRSRVSCFAACKGGPVMCVQPDGSWYYNARGDNLDRIITEHLVGGRPVEDLLFHQGPGEGGMQGREG